MMSGLSHEHRTRLLGRGRRVRGGRLRRGRSFGLVSRDRRPTSCSGGVGCAIGAGALLFQQDVSLAGGVLAPLFAAALLVGHVRVWDAVGVTLPAWVNIPPLGRRRAYASDPIQSQAIEEPMRQPNPTTQPEPDTGFDPEPISPTRSRSRARKSSRRRSTPLLPKRRGRPRSSGRPSRRDCRSGERAERASRSGGSARSRS